MLYKEEKSKNANKKRKNENLERKNVPKSDIIFEQPLIYYLYPQHFIDGKPTDEYPDPVRYDGVQTPPRKPQKRIYVYSNVCIF